MYKLLGGLANYLKYQDIVTDCAIFRMHNLFTTALLMGCSIIVTATQYVGNPIQCIVDGLPTHVVNTYCWISSTFTMPDAFRRQLVLGARLFMITMEAFVGTLHFVKMNPNSVAEHLLKQSQCILSKDRRPKLKIVLNWRKIPNLAPLHTSVGTEVAHPGLANDFNDQDAQKFYTYYQWVCFVLFFQAIACYTPKVIWGSFENGLMRMLVMGLNVGVCSERTKNIKKEIILEYLAQHVKRHNLYALRYWGCECLCLINIIVQMWCMNRFFDGEFLSYGLRVMNYSEQVQEDRIDPMVYVFPRVTKCIFHKYGPSGSIQKHDSMCILPLNIVNEKTYIFIWFWFVILLSMLTLLVIYRVLIIAMPKIRPRILHAKHRSIPIETCEALCRKVDLGDWWILMMLGTNLDPLIYRDVVAELVKKIDSSHTNQYR
ncbi:hypothetical protein HUJ05_002420 [Dendroctonus ponderosae]|nr:hypothetical protein HUJ05_002420 [Dendroctonus ponderosae]